MNPVNNCVNKVVVPTYYTPPRLVTLAAQRITRCLIYEDDQCYHYRWDPVNIWQFEIPLKKKKGRKSSERNQPQQSANEITFTPQPQWKEIKKFRDYWWSWSALGGLDSVLRGHVMAAVERCSMFPSHTQEEDVLFLLLRLTTDIKIELSGEHFQKFSEWCDDLAQVISHLGPFPLQKLFVTHDSLAIQPVLISIVQHSPNLQVVHMNQWALNNEFMSSLGSCCNRLTEFSIPLMKPQVFMNDEALFSCFFGGQTSEEVMGCWEKGENPRISFPKLTFIDILYWKQTEKFIQMMSVFYPNTRLRSVDGQMLPKENNPIQPIVDVKAKLGALVMVFRLGNLLHGRLEDIVDTAPYIQDVRVHIDDSFEFDTNSAEDFKQKLENAGVRLNDLVGKINGFEGLAVCPHSNLGISRVILPTLYARGKIIVSLHISYEFSQPDMYALYQAINLCPKLCYLALSLPLGITNKDLSDRNMPLQPCENLRTLVVRSVKDYRWDTGELDEEEEEEDNGPVDDTYISIVTTILEATTELRTLGISIALSMGAYFHPLGSNSVQTLHLQIVPQPKREMMLGVEVDEGFNFNDPLDSLLSRILPKFPVLTMLSLDPPEDDNFDITKIGILSWSAIGVTRWRPEFFQELPSWDTLATPSANLNINFHVM